MANQYQQCRRFNSSTSNIIEECRKNLDIEMNINEKHYQRKQDYNESDYYTTDSNITIEANKFNRIKSISFNDILYPRVVVQSSSLTCNDLDTQVKSSNKESKCK